MDTLSMDLRVRIFEARQGGESSSEVAERFGVSTAFVRRLMQRHRETGSLLPLQQRHGPLPVLHGQEERLREAIQATPDARPAELRDRLGLSVSATTVWRAIRRLGFSFKKKPFMQPNNSGPTSPPPASNGRA